MAQQFETNGTRPLRRVYEHRCEYCGEPFQSFRSNRRRFCSRKCYLAKGIYRPIPKKTLSDEQVSKALEINGLGYGGQHIADLFQMSYVTLTRNLKAKGVKLRRMDSHRGLRRVYLKPDKTSFLLQVSPFRAAEMEHMLRGVIRDMGVIYRVSEIDFEVVEPSYGKPVRMGKGEEPTGLRRGDASGLGDGSADSEGEAPTPQTQGATAN